MYTPDQEHQHHLVTCWKCKFSGPTLELNQTCGGWGERQCAFGQAFPVTLMHAKAGATGLVLLLSVWSVEQQRDCHLGGWQSQISSRTYR